MVVAVVWGVIVDNAKKKKPLLVKELLKSMLWAAHGW